MPDPVPRPGTFLASGTIVERAAGVIAAEIDGEVVMLSIERGMYYGLNRVGARVWQLIAAPARVEDICARLLAEFEVDRSDCENQLAELLQELRGEALITFGNETKEE